MNGKSPTITLNNGVEMPQLGLGVYLSPADQTSIAVRSAIENGYRLIDTAACYGNEQQVGQGIADSGAPREDLFITTKLWITDYGYDQALRAFDVSMEKLGLDYLDLYLLHWPCPSDWANTVQAWQAAEKLLADGRIRAIGVCNFTEQHLMDLASSARIVPAVNQIELHPLFSQPEMRAANAARGIVTQAWSPIGGVFINHPREPGNITRVLDTPVLVDIAQRLGKTPAQVVLRWHLQNGVAVIPKSANPDRIAANIDVFDFTLPDTDMAAINDLNADLRNGPVPDEFDQAMFLRRQQARLQAESKKNA